MKGDTFQPVNMTELLSMPNESREQAYRRGYHAGYVAALLHAFPKRKAIPDDLWGYWLNDLLGWVSTDTEKLVLPPNLNRSQK